MSTARLPRIAITLGDPNGVGPEVVVKALAGRSVRRRCVPVVVGDAEVVRWAARAFGRDVRVRRVDCPEDAGGRQGIIEVLDLNAMDERVIPGTLSKAAGRAAYAYIECAVKLAVGGQVDAIVTGPISKEGLHAAGHRYAGHTELLARLTGTKQTVMMLVHGQFRVSHVTTHVSLRDACRMIRKERVRQVIHLTHSALLRIGIPSPRIGVAGLNPHAGEGGLFGREEEREILPAIAEAVRAGIDAGGPVPPDTLFPHLLAGEFDAAVAMYHDQGHIPAKLLGFHLGARRKVAGVNLTLGLPIVRTSVDHGVAYDIAGRGIASEQSLLDAIVLAATMSAQH